MLRLREGFSQMRWVVLLLVVSVVLPTVCLLWFMTQAVRNERLAVRQKLAEVFQDQLVKTTKKTQETLQKKLVFFKDEKFVTQPDEVFISIATGVDFGGVIIFDASGRRTYPLLSSDMEVGGGDDDEFAEVWQVEFGQGNYAEAARLYEQKFDSYDDHIRLSAIIGKSRCMSKLGRIDEAIETCKKAAFDSLEKQIDSKGLVLIANARLLLLSFIKEDVKYSTLFEETFHKLRSMIFRANEAGAELPSSHNLFVARKVLEIRQGKLLIDFGIDPVNTHLEELIEAEERSIDMAEQFSRVDHFEDWKAGEIRCLGQGGQSVYGLLTESGGQRLVILLWDENVTGILNDFEEAFRGTGVAYRIVDEKEKYVAGVREAENKPFASSVMGRGFEGWRAELYFSNGDIFKEAARRQVVLYVWGGTLVIVLIFAAGGFAGKVISRQIKLNRIKNDFIATVTHELKTPLSSMRVLVDTLLEGNYNEQKQASEYLELVSKENKRLSRLIDNFLTFSRMERDKKAFDIIEANPAEIAQTAADAVKAKFNNGSCRFVVNIAEDLPDVSADKDAMVTVLVNLLDNAYKYSYDDKNIELKVYAEENNICFCVKDNGIGISRRSVKKIFNRFYQADSSLARRAGGCGLGLAIVKFIVDAHKGQINVESNPGEGSEFKVLIPVL